MASTRTFFGRKGGGHAKQPRSQACSASASTTSYQIGATPPSRRPRPGHHSTPLRSSLPTDNLSYQPGMTLGDHPYGNVHLSSSESDYTSTPTNRSPLASADNSLNIIANTSHPDPYCGGVDTASSTQHSHGGISHGAIYADTDICAMLQQQQAMLAQILQKQDELYKKQSLFESKLEQVESKLPSPLAASLDCSTGKRKRVVSRALSVSLYVIIFLQNNHSFPLAE